jgi:hypothetical protein
MKLSLSRIYRYAFFTSHGWPFILGIGQYNIKHSVM